MSPLPSRSRGGQPHEGEEEGPDRLLRRLSNRELQQLSEVESATLDAVMKVDDTQRHFHDSIWKLPGASGAPLKAVPLNPGFALEDANARGQLWEDLLQYANPLPTYKQWLIGISHHNHSAEYAGQLWEPVRALSTNKVFCLKQLEAEMLAASGSSEGLFLSCSKPRESAPSGDRGCSGVRK